jgi:hypothetical protein
MTLYSVERTKEEPKPISLKPGKTQVLFELGLDEVLLQRPFPYGKSKWRWDWVARPQPPPTPIHRYRDDGFVKKTTFSASALVNDKWLSSEQVELKVVGASSRPTYEETKPLGSLDLDLNRLKTWGTKSYIYEATRPGSTEKAGEGRIVLTTEIGPDSVTLEDSFALIYRGKEISLQLTHQCRKDNFLSPVRIESKGEGDDEVGTFVATIDGGRLKAQVRGRDKAMDLPDGTVSSSAFFRLVTLLPRQKGSRISYPYSLESGELNLKKDFMVECMGPDIVQAGVEGVTCTKFRLTGGGIRPAHYWVDDDGVLRQVLIDDRKMIRLRDESGVDE